jgi:acetylornithine/N-succinyldiaminopimelate aminotransferase
MQAKIPGSLRTAVRGSPPITQRGFSMTMLEREGAAFFHTYKRLPLEIDRGEGVYLIARDGTRYLDMFAGIAVNALGYGHPRILQAIEEQARAYIHLSNYFLQEPQLRLSEILTRASGYPRIFFANSGTEAVEGAIKLARRWGTNRNKNQLLSATNAFHGRTMGALSLMDRPKYREGFGPFLDGCTTFEFDEPAGLRKGLTNATAAVLLEFIQGEGGIRPVSREFAATLMELKERFGFLLIADEIQSGLGRTGKLFGFQHYDVRPDIVVMAKPIGGGLPLGAILATEEVAAILEPGMHGTTFGGNPVACAAGIAVVSEILERELIEHAAQTGNYLLARLRSVQSAFPRVVKEVRGYGLMAGMELHNEGESVVTAMRARKILINCTDQTVLRFVPPLIVANRHIDETCAALLECLQERAA